MRQDGALVGTLRSPPDGHYHPLSSQDNSPLSLEGGVLVGSWEGDTSNGQVLDGLGSEAGPWGGTEGEEETVTWAPEEGCSGDALGSSRPVSPTQPRDDMAEDQPQGSAPPVQPPYLPESTDATTTTNGLVRQLLASLVPPRQPGSSHTA
jgi:hypothetical protein